MPSVEQLKRQLLEMGILTLVTVLIWIGYGVYSALTNPSQSQVTKEELLPLPKNISLQQIEKVNERMVIEEPALRDWREKITANMGGQTNQPASESGNLFAEDSTLIDESETTEATVSGGDI